MEQISRRKFLLGLLSSPFLAYGYARFLERHWLNINRVSINPGGIKIAHFSDTHYLGDRDFILKVVEKINGSGCDVAFFTGDLIDMSDESFLDEALELITGIKIPVYGVPGNHDLRGSENDLKYKASFQKTDGDWLVNERVELPGFNIYGTSSQNVPQRTNAGKKSILLTHYPATCDTKSESKYDLVLAGHSHGGQVRLPFVGPLLLPYGVGAYDRGLFDTDLGKLYVNVGIGTFAVPVRFMCRPELTILTV